MRLVGFATGLDGRGTSTRHLAVAVPYCRWRELGADGDAWFKAWRTRLPNVHLYHFDLNSLVALLAHNGFD
ncbi:hypothetical protein [Mesorhizobium sp.]|uniref:hypothetical protein n=1 Tax=Mesorhizobium sp. TaxID=1871066 RepID=UPI0025BB8C59|nr:hypothetical protein [Mesorhizobium sp.]